MRLLYLINIAVDTCLGCFEALLFCPVAMYHEAHRERLSSGAVGWLQVRSLPQDEPLAFVETNAALFQFAGRKLYFQDDGAVQQGEQVLEYFSAVATIPAIGVDGEVFDVIKRVELPISEQADGLLFIEDDVVVEMRRVVRECTPLRQLPVFFGRERKNEQILQEWIPGRICSYGL